MATALSFAFGYILPLMAGLGLLFGGPWSWSAVAFAFVLTPWLDALVPEDRTNPSPDEVAERRSTPLFDVWLYAWLPVQLALMAGTFLAVPGGSWLERIGWVVSLGVVTGGGGITVAHELMHRPSSSARAAAEALMGLVLYPHFCIEHVLGHHRRVATEEDPASARRGESVYAFLPRTLIGGLESAWSLETQRVRSRGARGLADRRIRHPLVVLLVLSSTGAAFGPAGLLALLGQAVVAVLLLEVINYVEHYGLVRHQGKDGRYERVRPVHSWNSAHRVTGRYLFHLPRHSDHHFLASRPYFLLEHHDSAPQLPAGYPAMVLLALVPPLWRRVMDPRVDRWMGGDESLRETDRMPSIARS